MVREDGYTQHRRRFTRPRYHTKPGEKVGTDQIVTAQPVIVPQDKVAPICAMIWGATVFVDYSSKLSKVHLMQDASGDSTLEAKNAFERDCMT